MPTGPVPEHSDINKAIQGIWGSALQEQLQIPTWLPIIPRPPLSHWAKAKRWFNFYIWRVRDAWGVLRHGLPEQW